MTERDTLNAYIAEELQIDKIHDYCPNGLQVEGKSAIKTIVTGVTACQDLLDAAIAKNADAILVHHGYFWKGEPAEICGIKQRRIKSLLLNDINLFAYHLPLDIHLTLGNNVMLAQQLGITPTAQVEIDRTPNILWIGELAKPVSATDFAQTIQTQLSREPLVIDSRKQPISRIAWCTGGAQRYIEHTKAFNVDAYLTGEVSEPTVHYAREAGIDFFSAGHHATERYGIQALGQHLADKFGLEHHFIDIANPV